MDREIRIQTERRRDETRTKWDAQVTQTRIKITNTPLQLVPSSAKLSAISNLCLSVHACINLRSSLSSAAYSGTETIFAFPFRKRPVEVLHRKRPVEALHHLLRLLLFHATDFLVRCTALPDDATSWCPLRPLPWPDLLLAGTGLSHPWHFTEPSRHGYAACVGMAQRRHAREQNFKFPLSH